MDNIGYWLLVLGSPKKTKKLKNSFKQVLGLFFTRFERAFLLGFCPRTSVAENTGAVTVQSQRTFWLLQYAPGRHPPFL